MKSVTYIFLLYLFVITSCSSRRQLFNSQSNIHRENGWYHVMQGLDDSIAHEPIITVKDFIALRLDSDYFGKYVIVGQISKHKLKRWGDETEKAIGQKIAFLFNDSVITAPQVNCRIESGTFQISSLLDDNLPTIFGELRKEKIFSIEALFVGWEKDSIYYTSSQEQTDSIRLSMDYWEAKGWIDLTTKPQKHFWYDIQDSTGYKKLEKALEEEQKKPNFSNKASDYMKLDMSALLENKIWKVQLPKDKQYAMEMEFRNAGWRTTFPDDEKQTQTFYSYCLHGDTIKVFESGKKYIIQELTDSTLVFQYQPDTLTIDVGPVKCVTDNSLQGQWKNESRLDSIWRKEDIWNKGLSFIEQDIDTIGIEAPRWAKWNNLENYFTARMIYPEHLLEKNQAGYSVVMFSLDTLGLPRGINILTTIHKDFDKEVIRLIKELPHCLPCRNKNGKRMECLYTVYVPFLPQHYRDRVKADSIGEENLKQMFVEWEAMSYFEQANPHAVTNYINERLTYNPKLLNGKKETKGLYTIRINSYGEIIEVETLRSCGVPEWDSQVLKIIKSMPRWTPTIYYYGKGEYRESIWAIPIYFRRKR